MCRRLTPLSVADVRQAIRCLESPDAATALHRLVPEPMGSAYPNAVVCAIADEEGKLAATELVWGYAFDWQRGPVFNARLDTALRPDSLWHESLRHRRCLVPAADFFESHRSETTRSLRTGRPIKQQYRFADAHSPVLLLAGIYEGDRFAVVTTEPSPDVAPVHDRMPLVLQPDEARLWLTGTLEQLAALAARPPVPLAAEPEQPAPAPAAPSQPTLF